MLAWNFVISSQAVQVGGGILPSQTRELDQFPEMLHADRPAGLPSQSEKTGLSTQIPGTPPPPQQLHFTCDLAQPVARKEPLNSAPKQL